MNPHVYWLLELEIQPGRAKDFRTLMDEMVAATRADEPGALNYEWSTSADGKRCHIFERYADSGAVMAHMATFGARFASRFFEILKPLHLDVYGSPDDAVKNAFASSGPAYLESAGGFSR
jgi:quinol monooxygenase YgiN